MKLQIKNLGPIKNGEIDLTKRFYVFVGYNNSGKTYVSQLLWSLWNDKLDFFTKDLTNKIEGLEELDQSKLTRKISLERGQFDLILKKYNSYLLEIFSSSLNSDSKVVLKNAVFSISDYDFHRINEEEFKYGIRFIDKGVILHKVSGENIININPMPSSLFENYSSHPELTDNFDVFNVTSKNIACFDNVYFANFLLRMFFKKIRSTPFFLPANRLFYPNFYKYIYSASKEEKEKIGEIISSGETSTERLKPFSKTPYTKAMDAFTEEIFRFNSNGKVEANNYYEDLLHEMKKVLGGDIIMKRVEGIAPVEFYFQMEDGKELDMHVSSSSVNQLTTLYLYLKYWAKEKYNFLIVDEPEENLHPKNQIALLDILMKFANRNGNKVLITTHSSLVTDAVNNHLHLGYLKNKGIDIKKVIKENNLNIDSETALEHDDIGIYFFDGKKIVNYEVGEYGAYFRDFKKEENQVRDEANILKGMISDLENQKRKERFQKKNNA